MVCLAQDIWWAGNWNLNPQLYVLKYFFHMAMFTPSLRPSQETGHKKTRVIWNPEFTLICLIHAGSGWSRSLIQASLQLFLPHPIVPKASQATGDYISNEWGKVYLACMPPSSSTPCLLIPQTLHIALTFCVIIFYPPNMEVEKETSHSLGSQ